jgi:DNA-binding transcriptional regulator YhcF (GntR family)
MITVDLTSPVPLGEQIRAEIRDAIARGDVRPGESLPTVRQLAADLGINLNTVARAYRQLETEGLLTTIRGRGTIVRSDRELATGPKRSLRDRFDRAVRRVLSDARLAGLERRELEQVFAREANAIWPEEQRS